jgi:N-acetylglucosaminyl-diphospho-decaprenol L-rhamnosyltransferase
MPTPLDLHENIWNRVTVVTVTHDAGMVIGDFLESMNSSARLVIVDNASTDDTLDIIAAKRPSATLIKNKEGLGYGSGCNCGLDVVETEFSILANPDSIFSEDAIIKMLDTADRYQDVGLIGPTVLNSDGRVELSHDVELWKRDSYGKRNDELTADGELCAEFISGAVVLVRMTAIREINGFDREFFLYYEDDDMCLNLRRHGWKLLLVANAVVTHIGGGSVRVNRYYHWEKFWNIAWSRLYIEKKYHGTFAMIRLAVANIVKFTFKAVGYSIIFQKKKPGATWHDLREPFRLFWEFAQASCQGYRVAPRG